ncbi:EamA-like transporter family protein [Corynebacterium ciconiae DSM 44920]|uniref:DMT family transporter n=1 Tax=Corynebacterium ciconiae TaxID=227319 RepID=UPI001FCAD6C2|nr:DMT family transporter [Corynebacterium ciconiae]WKD60478.1 EamA-like transporter family protein [Corynebacterium ciconiae DSM 44920]
MGDILLFGAVVACGLGYAYGGFLSKTMPGWQVIAWGNVVALPVNLIVTGFALGHEPVHLTAMGLLGLAYVAGVSQFLGFVVWYSGMAKMGVARASQIQLAQPLLTVVWSILFMGEVLDPIIFSAAVIVIVCIAVTQRVKS